MNILIYESKYGSATWGNLWTTGHSVHTVKVYEILNKLIPAEICIKPLFMHKGIVSLYQLFTGIVIHDV